MAGQAHLLTPHHFLFLQRRKRRAAVLYIKCIYPAIMADGAFFCRVCLSRISQLRLRCCTYKTKYYGINYKSKEVLHLFMSYCGSGLSREHSTTLILQSSHINVLLQKFK
jgi:hypothetical protein